MQKFMEAAYAQACLAAQKNEVPVGAIVVSRAGEILAATHNQTVATHDPSAHAEILAIREATNKLQSRYLVDCDLYVTLEPCPMCAHALSLSRIKTLYYGAPDPKSGGVDHGPKVYEHKTCHHKPVIERGLLAEPCGALLTNFFMAKRQEKNQNKSMSFEKTSS